MHDIFLKCQNLFVLANYLSLFFFDSFQEKAELYGPCRVAVGGRGPADQENPCRGAITKNRETLEPVFWHGKERRVVEDFLSTYSISAVIDLAASDGTVALACAVARRRYLGFTCTMVHKSRLREQLVYQLLSESCRPSGALYDPKLARALGDDIQAAPAEPRARPGPRPRGSAANAGQNGGPASTGSSADVLSRFQAGHGTFIIGISCVLIYFLLQLSDRLAPSRHAWLRSSRKAMAAAVTGRVTSLKAPPRLPKSLW